VADSQLKELVGRDLASVQFVRDYFQLHFDGPTLNVTTAAELADETGTYSFSEPGFSDAICKLINQVVIDVVENEAEVLLSFERASLRLSLSEGSFNVEALEFFSESGKHIVFD
jgi:hypothetical protein